jgi:hypothetical protein
MPHARTSSEHQDNQYPGQLGAMSYARTRPEQHYPTYPQEPRPQDCYHLLQLDQKFFNGHFGQTSFNDTISFSKKSQLQAKPLSLPEQERVSCQTTCSLIKDEVQTPVSAHTEEKMLMRGGLNGTFNGVQDVDSNIAGKQMVESGDDLRALTPLLQLWHDYQRKTGCVSDDLHVVNSNLVFLTTCTSSTVTEFLGNSDWKDGVASRALYDTRKLQKGYEISSMVVEKESYIIDGRPSLIGTGQKRLEVTSTCRSEYIPIQKPVSFSSICINTYLLAFSSSKFTIYKCIGLCSTHCRHT